MAAGTEPGILLGDLNVNGRKNWCNGTDSEEYLNMLSILQSPEYTLRDVLKADKVR